MSGSQWLPTAKSELSLPPKEFCPLCPTSAIKNDFKTEIADSAFEVVVFENRFPSFTKPPLAPIQGMVQAAGRCEIVVYSDQHERKFRHLTSKADAHSFSCLD
ncbi:MAG: hypothetical protein WDN07_00360 [Actinomycetota bacterium]